MRLEGNFRINLDVGRNPGRARPHVPTGAAAPKLKNPSKIKGQKSAFINPTNEIRTLLRALPPKWQRHTRREAARI
jgi:hypothetical protein